MIEAREKAVSTRRHWNFITRMMSAAILWLKRNVAPNAGQDKIPAFLNAGARFDNEIGVSLG